MKALINIFVQKAPYLDSTRNKLLHISFLAAFTAIFLSVYSPFNMSEWGGNILGYVVIGSSVSLISQFLLRPILGLSQLKLYQMLLLAAFEFILITFFLYLIYGVEYIETSQKLGEYAVTLKFVCLILAGPYFLSIWFLASKHKDDKLVKGKTHNTQELLTIKSDNNKIVLAIRYDQILYVKSSGNYVDIYHLKGEKVSKELVRISLKELELNIENPNILRVHRSSLVNKNMISSFKKNRKGYDLVVKHISDETVSVSSGYKESFEESMLLKLAH